MNRRNGPTRDPLPRVGRSIAAAEGKPSSFATGTSRPRGSSRTYWSTCPPAIARSRPICGGYGDSETKPVGDERPRRLRGGSPSVRRRTRARGAARHRRLVERRRGRDAVRDRPPEAVASLVLVNPLSPYGFGGTKDTDGTPCFDDYAGSGGGIGNDAFVAGLENRDRSEEGQTSPRKVLRTYYVDPTHEFDSEREESYLTGMLDTATGDKNYPGSSKSRRQLAPALPGRNGREQRDLAEVLRTRGDHRNRSRRETARTVDSR